MQHRAQALLAERLAHELVHRPRLGDRELRIDAADGGAHLAPRGRAVRGRSAARTRASSPCSPRRARRPATRPSSCTSYWRACSTTPTTVSVSLPMRKRRADRAARSGRSGRRACGRSAPRARPASTSRTRAPRARGSPRPRRSRRAPVRMSTSRPIALRVAGVAGRAGERDRRAGPRPPESGSDDVAPTAPHAGDRGELAMHALVHRAHDGVVRVAPRRDRHAHGQHARRVEARLGAQQPLEAAHHEPAGR